MRHKADVDTVRAYDLAAESDALFVHVVAAAQEITMQNLVRPSCCFWVMLSRGAVSSIVIGNGADA
ncbi:hypothetical protein CERZMDRAFT_90382 [Cercospora zeae-maydis SCOH1-5]|uniref:Uncharacterized protein n=1 Tax=Cercospora zeae-maydis SCOH1-5 TaxID=717836 RepID=A0A6A6FKB1_9PEZI|nr:hypothetical protein CERZMDRAFT_90382 [Cercospora zeae-maydis SCOH1-5]